MYSGLLTPQSEMKLSEASDLSALVGLLKTTVYAPYLAGLEDQELTPRRAVHQVKSRIADVYHTLIHMAPPHTRPVLAQLFRHFEVSNLKAILRGIAIGSSWESLEGVMFPLGSFSVLPAQQMLETGNIEAAVLLLTGTPYYETLSQAMKRYTSEQSLFPLEVALDLNYWRKLWSTTTQLPGSDRTQAIRIIGSLVDVTNLMWALRYRVYYRLSEEEVINYTLPFGHRVRDEDIRAIAAGTDIARVLERLFPGLQNVEALLQEPERGLPKLELQLQRRLRQRFVAVFAGYPFHIGLPLALAALNELELQDLTVLVEAKSALKPAEEYNPYLLMADQGSNN
jgi:V/A-type H+-transporting ATPase subunit C